MAERWGWIEFEVDGPELDAIREAAKDAHMEVAEYARLMVLAAAGMGGVLEHLNRAVDASVEVDALGPNAATLVTDAVEACNDFVSKTVRERWLAARAAHWSAGRDERMRGPSESAARLEELEALAEQLGIADVLKEG